MTSSDRHPGSEVLELPVADLMSRGVLEATAGESLAEAAARMSENRVHALAVESESAPGGFVVLSGADLLAALGSGQDPDQTMVESVAATEPLTIAASATAAEAARVMSEHQVAHLFVVESEGAPPSGVISSLDLARALSEGPTRRGRLRILVGHDGHTGGDDAVGLAALLAAGNAEVLAAIVVPFRAGEVGDPALPTAENAATWEELCRGLSDAGSAVLAERALPVLADLDTVERVVLDDSSARALTALTEVERPDFVVIGSTHRGPVGRVMLGTTGDRLAHGSNAPIAIAPRGFADARPREIARIGVGFDGGEQSLSALDLAARMAQRHGALLELVAVVERKIGDFEIAAEALDVLTGEALHDRRAEGLRGQAQQALKDRGLGEASVEVRHGDAVSELVAAAHDEQLDLLVLGSRGYGSIARVLLGSVADGVCRDAPCPTVLARRES